MTPAQRQIVIAEKLLRFASASLLIGRTPSLPEEYKKDLFAASVSFVNLSHNLQKGIFVSDEVLDMLQRLVAVVEVLVTARLVPSDALSVIQNEVRIVKQELASLPGSFALLSKEDFVVNEDQSPLSLFAGRGEKGLPQKMAPKTRSVRPAVPRPSSVSGSEKPIQNGSRDEERSRKILDFLKQNGTSSISEVAKAVPDYSSKTVQRELQILVDEGKVSKVGERRWSRYSAL